VADEPSRDRSGSATLPAPPRYPKHLLLTVRQRIGLPLLFAVPIVALAGVFGPGRITTVVRVAGAYVFVWGCFRLVGKRELKAMSPFELVTLLFVAQLFARTLTHEDYSFTNAIVGVTTLFALLFLTSVLSYRFRPVARVLQSEPTILAQHGTLVIRHLDEERVDTANLFAEMHKVGLSTLDQVEWAILESDGTIALIPSSRIREGER
jgi:uncharacterized membrane protein YcaP (DUF421 family)